VQKELGIGRSNLLLNMGHIIDARYLDDGRMEGQFQPGRQEVLTWSSRKGAVRGQSTRALCKHLANRNESIILSA